MKVLDNFLTKSESNTLKDYFFDNKFEWYYQKNILDETDTKENRMGFAHTFMMSGKIKSKRYDVVKMISDKVNYHLNYDLTPFNVRSFLQIPLNKKLYKKPEDKPHTDITDKHTVYLYYINDCDGDTIIYDNDKNIVNRITPKQGRIIIFDGKTYHSSSQPTRGPRAVINYNMV